MILDTLAAAAKARIAKLKKQKSLAAVREEAEGIYNEESVDSGFLTKGSFGGKADRQEAYEGKESKRTNRFSVNLQRPSLNFICECKKASPSKGLISPEFHYLEIAKSYEAGGAAAISVLTEPEYFLGSDEYLKEIAAQVDLPVLRKDFTVSEYQIYEAKTLGASAILLICSILSPVQLQEFRLAAESVGLDVLVETHDAGEVATALRSGAKIIGINNRNLKDFTVDINTCLQLRAEIPDDRICIAESGVRTENDIRRLKAEGFNGVLIGESLMRSGNPEEMLRKLKEA